MEPKSIKVVPKGLRSYDEHDADFFLDLLPGPRRSDGLPESIHFWKTRIEETDPDETFTVGVIYGPSGCGKSSLVKAGLLTRLADTVTATYIEATAGETEARLLRGLRKSVPVLPSDLDLQPSLIALKIMADQQAKKFLIVIDQFEQWLHAKRMEQNSELVQSLRNCDGNRVQAIVMVRVDFFMALTRFMEELGVELQQTRNFAAVDLFDMRHAKKILTAFGQAEGALPENLTDFTELQEKFLDQAVSELAQDGKVVSVRLTLFFEMVKSRPWTPTTLKEVGGMEGLGVSFLEEKFYSPLADPRYRGHQKAAQSVLKALLPESGTIIYGNARSQQALLEISGYVSRLKRFDELLRILDGELRLITPTEPAGSTVEDQWDQQSRERYYQLTHDYLVPSIRGWLVRKQKETWRGWFEIRLAERSALWNVKPVNRYLSPVWEWSGIRLLTKKRDWTKPQRRMMRRAGWVTGMKTLAVVCLLGGLTFTGLTIRKRVIENNKATVAERLVDSLRTASTADVLTIVGQLDGYRRWANPLLKTLVENPDDKSREKLHASLALLPVDPSQLPFLEQHLLNTTATELPVIRDSLKPHQASLTPKLWSTLDSAKPGDLSLLRAASALADYDGTSRRWEDVGGKVAQALVTVNPVYLGPWLDALRPVRTKLTTPLVTIFRDKNCPETERTLATSILKDYASDDTTLAADLLMDADPKAYAAFFCIIGKSDAAKTLPRFEAEIRKKATIPDSDKDSELVKDQLAERQARAAVALLRLGKVDEVLPLLRHSADPRLRSFIVNWLNPLRADPMVIAAEFDRIPATHKPTPAQGQQFMDAVLFHPETSKRRALILALGTYGTEGLSPNKRELLVSKLLDLYQNDPDSGIHGAAEWTLRKWGQQNKLKEVDAQLMKVEDWGERRWFVNSQGQTFAVIDGPVEFHMGSPPWEADRDTNETLHQRIIPRRFAIAAKEVTVEEYQEFVKENPRVDHAYKDKHSPDPKGPMNGVSWYHAAAYCNWLSRKENLPECYEPNDQGQFAEGMTIRADALSRTGYRLPTEAEWEYACRSGTGTSRYYGVSVNMLGSYAWFWATSPNRAQPCGSLLPNDLGLFDMLGNVYEWCQEQFLAYEPGKGVLKDDINIQLSILDKHHHLQRGGAFYFRPDIVRSASRLKLRPSERYHVIGFRLARTYH